MNPIDLTGRVAFITGANRGIGAAIAVRLARADAHVVASARSGSAAEAIAAQIHAGGGSAEGIAADVTDYAALEAAITAITAHHGRLDAVIANAGTIEPIARLGESDPAA